jgi:DHA1 family bicyclomycin/chloramphenicol resistance-like MFS transporter
MTRTTDRSTLVLLTVLAVAMAYSPISIDFFTPFLPGVTRELGWSISQLQVSIYGFFIGYGIAPFLWGGLADHYGRRKVMLAGLVVYCCATICCMLSSDILVYSIARVGQGAGAATGVVLSRVILRDIYGPEGATKAISSMYLIVFHELISKI